MSVVPPSSLTLSTKPAAPPPPSPAFYLTVGQPVTCLLVRNNKLVVGTARGSIIIYSARDWRKVAEIEAFSKGGLLWVDIVNIGDVEAGDACNELRTNKETLVCQGRFDGVKLFRPEDSSWLKWVETANFAIPHSGFCGGFVKRSGNDIVAVVASEQSKLVVANLVRTFIRPVVSLVREKSGTVMCVREWDKGRVVAGYESGEVIVWDWSNNSLVTVVTLVGLVGTVMSLAWDMEKRMGVVVGAEDKVVVINEELEVVRERVITNKGVGEVQIRGDRKIAVCGGWDGRLRVFSWVKPDKLKPLAVLKFHAESVEAVAFSEVEVEGGRLGGRRVLAAGGKDGKVSLWDIY